jgi:hypothetical protein
VNTSTAANACVRAHHRLAWQLAHGETPWVCGICHPPARGLPVTWGDGTTERVGESRAPKSAEQSETMKRAA